MGEKIEFEDMKLVELDSKFSVVNGENSQCMDNMTEEIPEGCGVHDDF